MRLRPNVLLLLLLAAGAARAQEERVERDFDLIVRAADGRALQNVYWVSLPGLPALDDVADSGTSLTNSCVGDVDGPSAPDGRIDVDDVICAWWTARADRPTAGTFTVSRVLPNRCDWQFRSATVALGHVRFSGEVYPLEEGAGLQVRITRRWGDASQPRNHAILQGDHDRGFPGLPIEATPTCTGGQTTDCCGPSAPRLLLVSVPYDTFYRTSDEILCGQEGVDWVDANGDGLPDTCWDDVDGDRVFDAGEAPTGIFDVRVAISVMKFANDESTNAPIARSAVVFAGSWRLTGTRFDLVPGEAYLVFVSKTHAPTNFLPPVP